MANQILRILLVVMLVGMICCNQTPTTVRPPIQKPNNGATSDQTCPVPTEEMLRCLRQWACQYIVRLDLRCLLNLNGNPLLGNVLGGTNIGGASGGSILGNILGG